MPRDSLIWHREHVGRTRRVDDRRVVLHKLPIGLVGSRSVLGHRKDDLFLDHHAGVSAVHRGGGSVARPAGGSLKPLVSSLINFSQDRDVGRPSADCPQVLSPSGELGRTSTA